MNANGIAVTAFFFILIVWVALVGHICESYGYHAWWVTISLIVSGAAVAYYPFKLLNK